MNSETIVYCVVALILGMLLAHMLKDVCGCKTVEGTEPPKPFWAAISAQNPFSLKRQAECSSFSALDGSASAAVGENGVCACQGDSSFNLDTEKCESCLRYRNLDSGHSVPASCGANVGKCCPDDVNGVEMGCVNSPGTGPGCKTLRSRGKCKNNDDCFVMNGEICYKNKCRSKFIKAGTADSVCENSPGLCM
tara:strand:- start:1447 stop:2025 length:579 start_codon:yes stop_codon:yes gene_type:complete